MLRILYTSGTTPYSWPVDPSAEFQPGQVAQLFAMGNQVVAGVSDGRIPLGIIDDIKTTAFTSVSIDEEVIAPVVATEVVGGKTVSLYDIKVELKNPNIDANSFISKYVDVVLNPRNGVITFVAGTELNFSQTNSGVPDAIRDVVSYTYQVPNIPGDDSTLGSNRVTVWTSRMIIQTDQYDTSVTYPLNAVLFVNSQGKFTTRRPSADYPAIGLVVGPPVSINGSLELFWF